MTVCVTISLFAAASAHGSRTDGDHCFSLLRLCLLASLQGPYQEDHLMEMFCLGILDYETLIKLFKVEPLEI